MKISLTRIVCCYECSYVSILWLKRFPVVEFPP